MLQYNKEDLIGELKQRHLVFAQYLDNLSKRDFEISRNSKWSAGQELDHILKSIRPLSEILRKKKFILNQFGKGNGISSDYHTLVSRYKIKLSEGGHAFGKFLPEKVTWDNKPDLLNQLFQLIQEIEESLQLYTEVELNELRIPHPLMGMLTVREMMYFTIYHVMHHQFNTVKNLGLVSKPS